MFCKHQYLRSSTEEKMKSSIFIIFILILSAIITPASAQTAAVSLIDETTALYNQGTSLYERHKYREAIEAFKKYIQLKPDSAPAYNNLGVAYSDSGAFSQAVVNFKEAVRLEPNYAAAHRNLGAAL